MSTLNLRFEIPSRMVGFEVGTVNGAMAVKVLREDQSEIFMLDGSIASEDQVFVRRDSFAAEGFDKYGILAAGMEESDLSYLVYLAKADVNIRTWIDSLEKNGNGDYKIQSTEDVKVFRGWNNKGFVYENGTYFTARICRPLNPVLSAFLDHNTTRIPNTAVYSITSIEARYKSGLLYGEIDAEADRYVLHYIPATVCNVIPGDNEDVWMKNPALMTCLSRLRSYVEANGLVGKETFNGSRLLRALNEPSQDIPTPSIAVIAAIKVNFSMKKTCTFEDWTASVTNKPVTSLADERFSEFLSQTGIVTSVAEEIGYWGKGPCLFFKRRDGGTMYEIFPNSFSSAMGTLPVIE